MGRINLKAAVLLFTGVVFIIGLAIQPASATVPGVNEVANVNTSGGAPDYAAGQQSMSQDGRYVAFSSTATNLVSGISGLSGSTDQVYVRDRKTNTAQLVSISSTTGVAGNNSSTYPEISSNGRYVVFTSTATNLTSTSNDGVGQVYIRDLKNSTTSIVSTNSSGNAGNARSYMASVSSSDGRYVTFTSDSTNLVSGTSAIDEVYLKDMVSGSITLVSASSGSPANSTANNMGISCEGRFIVFTTQSNNLVSGDTSGNWNIYLADELSGSLTDLTPSVPSGTGISNVNMSCNGNYFVFNTNADNLVSGVTNGYNDTYEYDRVQGAFSLVSVASDGTQPNNDSSGDPTVSNDGRYVAFQSTATNLVTNDTNGTYNVYLHDTQTGTTQMLDVNSSGSQANAYSMEPVISSDGRYVSYQSAATNLVSGFTSANGLYVSQTGTTGDY